ncbi:MAG: hypothetical protein AAF380_02555, partial [Bacteroidota bacterium]
SYKTQEQLEVHKVNLHCIEPDNIKQFYRICYICNQKFADYPRKNAHIKRTHDSSNEFSCRYCENYHFTARNVLSKHITNEHEGQPLYYCKYYKKGCTQKFYCDHHTLQYHQKKCSFKDTNAIEIDQEPYSTKSKEKDSTSSSHSITRPIKNFHQCMYCSKKIEETSNLKKHKEIHTHSYVCTFCSENDEEKRFKTAKELQTHRDECHAIEKVRNLAIYFCDQCGTLHKHKSDVKKHKKKFHDNGDQKCELCECSYKTQEQLEVHKVNLHCIEPDNIKQFYRICYICNKEFWDYPRKNTHIKNTHDPSNEFSCRYCENHHFITKSALSKHITNEHKGQPLYYCKYYKKGCKKIFQDSRKLSSHQSKCKHIDT